jgi:hypothetical protein
MVWVVWVGCVLEMLDGLVILGWLVAAGKKQETNVASR